MSSLRILHSTSSMTASAGGPSRSIRGLCMALKNSGHDVGLFISDLNGKSDVQDLLDLGIEVFVSNWSNVTEKWRSADLIHDHGVWLPANHRCAQFANSVGVPRISSPRGMLEPWALNHKKWKKRVAWWLYQHRDIRSCVALHATAKSEADQFRKLGLGNEIGIVPNGVDVSLVPYYQVADAKPRDSQRTVLFLSRIHPKKGLPLLVEAWARLRPEGWRMRVVGPDEGGHRAIVENLVKEAGLSDVWQFDGLLEHTDKWIAISSADIFILPTYSENFGISIAEALVSGIPVITTTGTPWLGLMENRCGWYVEPTVEKIMAALSQAISTPTTELQNMGARGREWMMRDYMWDGVGKQMTEFYSNVLLKLK